jgi:predicted nucleotidyltransferase
VSARFFRLDKPKIGHALQRYTDGLAEDPRVLGVVLFGSLARGDATAMSDADVLIILSDHPDPFHVRAPAFLRPGIGIAMDVFPYTLEEALQALREGQGILPLAIREGRWLLERQAVRSRLTSALPPAGGTAARARSDP